MSLKRLVPPVQLPLILIQTGISNIVFLMNRNWLMFMMIHFKLSGIQVWQWKPEYNAFSYILNQPSGFR